MLVNFLPLHTRLLALAGIAVLLASCTKPVPVPPPLKPDTFESKMMKIFCQPPSTPE